MNEISSMQKFADPALFDTLSFGEKMMGAGITTLMGMSITFIILILLWGIIALMAKFTSPKPKSQEPAVAAAPAVVGAPVVKAEVHSPDASELIAVITAAITAFEADKEVKSNLIIRKISRIAGQQTSWGSAGSSDAIDSRKF